MVKRRVSPNQRRPILWALLVVSPCPCAPRILIHMRSDYNILDFYGNLAPIYESKSYQKTSGQESTILIEQFERKNGFCKKWCFGRLSLAAPHIYLAKIPSSPKRTLVTMRRSFLMLWQTKKKEIHSKRLTSSKSFLGWGEANDLMLPLPSSR